jgi:SAM-dependent methyltransferase
MAREKKIDSKEVGLELGLVFFRFFLKSDHLHYGLFTEGLKADTADLKEAQERYTAMLMELIPEGAKTILDVGCGSGATAKKLLEAGYDVECVSPGKILTAQVRKLLGPDVVIYQSKFEALQKEKKYDVVLFSESFQYIPVENSIPGALKRLNVGGKIIIADFFKREVEGKSPLGGGHNYNKWLEALHQMPVAVTYERDITDETAPTLDIVHQFSNEVLYPVWQSVFALAEDRYPRLLRFVKWRFRKKIEKLENKHFTGQRNAAMFKKFKKYMVYVVEAK